MFTIRIQSVKQTKLGKEYLPVKSVTVEKFDESLADKAREYAKESGLVVQMYIDHNDTIPVGYSSKKLEFSTAIWKTTVTSLEDALAQFTS